MGFDRIPAATDQDERIARLRLSRTQRVGPVNFGQLLQRFGSAVRALEHVGASVELTADPGAALGADGLLVPGVGNFHACAAGLRAADGPLIIGRRLAGGVFIGLGVFTALAGSRGAR